MYVKKKLANVYQIQHKGFSKTYYGSNREQAIQAFKLDYIKAFNENI